MPQFVEWLYNLATSNSVGKAIGGTASTLVTHSAAATVSRTEAVAAEAVVATITLRELIGKYHIFLRLAGISGLTAVLMNHIGPMQSDRDTFKAATTIQICHALALFMVPFVHKPTITGICLIAGSTFYSGVVYFHALTGNKRILRYAPIGLNVLLLGWFSILM